MAVYQGRIEQFDEYIKSAIKKYSIPYLDLTFQSGFYPVKAFSRLWCRSYPVNGEDWGDGVHPNYEYNVKFLAPQILGFLRSVI